MSQLCVTHGLQHARLPCPLPSPRVVQIHVRWISDAANHLILCCPLLLLPSIFSSIRIFSIESALHIRWPKYWNFCFSISPSSDHSGLISFKIDWFDLLAVQGTLESSPAPQFSICAAKASTPAPQFKSINSLALNLLYGPTLTSVHGYWKNHSFDYTTFVGKVLSLLSCLLMGGQFSGRSWTVNTFWML